MLEDDTLTQDEAARVLDISPRQFRNLVTARLIRRVSRGKYDANEVFLYKRLKEKKKLGFTYVAMMAIRAEQSSRQTERLVRQLLSALDIGAGLISLEKEDVEALHIRIEDELCMVYPMTVEEVTQWTRTFNSMGEEYFEAIELHMGLEEPWVPYWQLAVKMCREAPREQCRHDKYLSLAYECLHRARNRIDQIAYFYARERHGKVRALTAFKGARGDMHDDIVGIAMWHAKKRDEQR